MDNRINDLSAIDRKYVFHPSTHLAQFERGDIPNRVMTDGSGIYVRDRDGLESLDAFAGLYCVNIGYGRTEVADAIYAHPVGLDVIGQLPGDVAGAIIAKQPRLVVNIGLVAP